MSAKDDKSVPIRAPTEEQKKKPEEEKKGSSNDNEDKPKEKPKDVIPLDEEDIALIKSYVSHQPRAEARERDIRRCGLRLYTCSFVLRFVSRSSVACRVPVHTLARSSRLRTTSRS
jgi:hypothetical protein